jgi:hypothetical protein
MRCDRKPALPGKGDRKPLCGFTPIRSHLEAAKALGMTSHQLRHAEQKLLLKLREALTVYGYHKEINR